MNDPLTRIEAQIAKKRAELSDLEIAARVLREMEPPSVPAVTTTIPAKSSNPPVVHQILNPVHRNGFGGLTMAECAKRILAERGPMHFKEIATEALRRGYVSPKGGDEQRIVQSFWATLTRKTLLFASAGRGMYKLATAPEDL